MENRVHDNADGSYDNPKCEIIRSEKTGDDKIWKFVMATLDKKGSFELGSFIHEDTNGGLRHDICVSTMAGCPLACKMCAIPYSESPYDRTLKSDEIEHQIRLAIEQRRMIEKRPMRNVVGFMGNGEPFLNIDAWVPVVENLLGDPDVRPSSFTVSTTGIRPEGISHLADSAFGKSGVGKIQYSLMSMDIDRRKALIPVSGVLKDCLPHLDEYARKTGQAIKYNVALIDGKNDSPEEANAFAAFINQAPGLRRAKISTFNPIPGVNLQPSLRSQIDTFTEILRANGVDIKMFFGDLDEKIYASCGQLRAGVEKILKSR